MSIPNPRHQPCMAAITGLEHFSMEVMAAWKESMCRRSRCAVRAMSSLEDLDELRMGFDERLWRSRPTVKALGSSAQTLLN